MINKDNWFHLALVFVGPVFTIALIQVLIDGFSSKYWDAAFAGLAFVAASLILQTIVEVLLLFPIWILSSKRVDWSPLDIAGAFLPWAIWALLILLAPIKSKSFSNVLIEGAVIGGAAPVGALFRVAIGPAISERNAVRTSLALSGVIAFCIWFIFPPLGE